MVAWWVIGKMEELEAVALGIMEKLLWKMSDLIVEIKAKLRSLWWV